MKKMFVTLILLALCFCLFLIPVYGVGLIIKIGTVGSGNGQFNYPTGVAVDSSGNIYVTDTNNYRVEKFSPAGEFITAWGTYGIGAGQLASPEGITIDSKGNVYVADTKNNRIEEFSPEGEYIAFFGNYSSGEVSGDGQLSMPEDVAVDSNGNVYVADTYNNRVQKFNANGDFVAKWGSQGQGDRQFDAPRGIAVDSAGNVYVADTNNSRMQKYDSNGKFITKWGYKYGDGISVYDVTVDSKGNVYFMVDSGCRVDKYDSKGKLLTSWGSYGTGDMQFNQPKNICIDSAGNAYVVDYENSRIMVFKQ